MHLIPTEAMKDSDISIEPELKLEIAVSIFFKTINSCNEEVSIVVKTSRSLVAINLMLTAPKHP